MSPQSSLRPLAPLVTTIALLLAGSKLAGQSALTPPAGAPGTAVTTDQAIVLSPFTVEAGSERGYLTTAFRF